MSDIADVEIGSVIQFQSKAVNDNNYYHGTVIGTVNYKVAKRYTDIYTCNTSVQSADPTVPEVELETFLLIELLEVANGETRYTIPFATDWINLTTLNIISSNRIAIIKVYDVDASNSQDVIDLLMTGGFKAKIDSLT